MMRLKWNLNLVRRNLCQFLLGYSRHPEILMERWTPTCVVTSNFGTSTLYCALSWQWRKGFLIREPDRPLGEAIKNISVAPSFLLFFNKSAEIVEADLTVHVSFLTFGIGEWRFVHCGAGWSRPPGVRFFRGARGLIPAPLVQLCRETNIPYCAGKTVTLPDADRV